MKDFLIRLLTSTSKIDLNQQLEVKLAESYEEYSRAFSLLHDAYVAKGLMEKHDSGLRCNIHSFLPHNLVVVVIDKEQKEVVGTVSIILDNLLGLPAEKAYPTEVEKIRKIKNKKMVEVSALAVDPKYRHQSHIIQFMLNKFLYQFCKINLGVDMLIIVVHPKAELFYHALMGFEPLGEIIEYDFVKGALARFLYLDFSGEFEERLKGKYFKMKYSFFDYVVNREDARLKLFSETKKQSKSLCKRQSLK
jgi:phosphate starvation-inducible membrane PsiE